VGEASSSVSVDRTFLAARKWPRAREIVVDEPILAAIVVTAVKIADSKVPEKLPRGKNLQAAPLSGAASKFA
jgi:hypothetical protein